MAPLPADYTPCRYCNYPSDGEYLCDPDDPNICMPCQKLVELEQKIKEIKVMLAGFKSERLKLKEQANLIHDRLIHRLPPEISAKIFGLCLPEDIIGLDLHRSSKFSMYAPLILSAVCKRWRAIACSTPQLWSSLPMVTQLATSLVSPSPVVVKEWIDRTGELPLSVSLCVPHDYNRLYDRKHLATIQMIELLNQYSNRWLKLKYSGPSWLISHFSSTEEDLPQLGTLCLLNNDRSSSIEPEIDMFKGHPKQLKSLSVHSINLVALDIDWDHLIELEMTATTPDCFEALRRAPRLTRCILKQSHTNSPSEFSLPPHRIVRSNIHYLEITHDIHEEIAKHLSCPSLKTLVLNVFAHHGDMPPIVEFLRTSGCSLETLSLVNENISNSDITLLCQEIPTLQHLHVSTYIYGTVETSRDLFAHLAEFSIVNGRKEPRYFPNLHSLTLNQCWGIDLDHWAMLPDIFGTCGTSHSIERHRHALAFVKVLAPRRNSQEKKFREDTLRKILWLREQGVKWEIQNSRGKDMLQLTANQYGISLS